MASNLLAKFKISFLFRDTQFPESKHNNPLALNFDFDFDLHISEA